jgi:hypothetical protein
LSIAGTGLLPLQNSITVICYTARSTDPLEDVMWMPDPRLPELLKTIRWHVRPETLALVGLPLAELPAILTAAAQISAPFWQIIVEPEMVTLVLPESAWRILAPAFPDARVQPTFRAISFDADLDANLVGFMALLSRAIAEAGVSLLAVCSYSRDHLLVREADLHRATSAIEALIAAQRTTV